MHSRVNSRKLSSDVLAVGGLKSLLASGVGGADGRHSMSTSGDNDEVLSRSSARAAPQPVAVAVPSGAGAAAGSGSIGPCETGSSTPRTEPRPQTTDHHVSPSDSSQPQPPAETTVTGASPTGAVHGLAPSRPTLTEIEGRMRDQIRRLQEARAAAMMAEIVDLQRERDLTMGRVRRLERSMAGGWGVKFCEVDVPRGNYYRGL